MLDDFNLRFSEVINNNDNKPIGRLVCETSLGITKESNCMILCTFTVRGAPESNTINSAIEFIKKGRDLIVCRFSELTTEKAHEKWGRLK